MVDNMLTSNSSLATQIVSNATEVVSNATQIVSNATELVSNATEVVSNATQIVSNATELVSNATNLCTATATSITNCSATSTCADSPANGRVYVRDGLDYLELGAFVLIDVVGVVGNGFVLGVVALCEDMRIAANYFIVSLSVADLLVCLVIVPIVTSTRWNRVWSLGDTGCDFMASINLTCRSASLFNLAAIAINRVIITRRPGQYLRLFTKSLSMIYIAITWFFSLLFALLPAFGWGESEFDEVRLICVFSQEAAPGYSIFFAICCVLISQVICGVCYSLVLITFRTSRHTLEQLPDVRVSGNSADQEKRLTKNLFVIWIAFVVCWLPIMSLLIIDPQGTLSNDVYIFSAWMMASNSCVNPIIYGVANKKFRSAYFRLIKKTPLLTKCRKSEVGPVPQLRQIGSSRPVQGTSRSLPTGPKFNSTRVKSIQGTTSLELPKNIPVRGRFIEVKEFGRPKI